MSRLHEAHTRRLALYSGWLCDGQMAAEGSQLLVLCAPSASSVAVHQHVSNACHHPLLVLDPGSRFLIVDRKGPEKNLEEYWFEAGVEIRLEV